MVKSPGSNLYKVDLHIHTPQSNDYRDKDASATDIVQAALNAGLNAIAITDHNDYRFIDAIKSAALGTELVVFPGVEVSTSEGHLLVIFDPDKDETVVKDFLMSCCSIRNTEFGEESTICDKKIDEVAAEAKKQGGIAIAAHFDDRKGLLQAVTIGQRKIKIVESLTIEAYELCKTENKNRWLEGIDYGVSLACIQGSDAHSIDRIGHKPIWVRVAELNIAGLQQAFNDPKVRIRFPNEYQPYDNRGYIESLEISQGFFGDVKIEFNPGLNCIIGGQGVGKSAIIEFIRFVLNQPSGVSEIRKDHDGKLYELLGIGGVISAVLRMPNGTRIRVQRTFYNKNDPVNAQKILDDGSYTDYDIEDISKHFDILAYSQGEGLSIARDSVRQLELIDSHINLSSSKSRLAEYRSQLRKNTETLKKLDPRLDDIADIENRKQTLENDIKKLTETLQEIREVRQEPSIVNNQMWMDEKNYLAGLVKSLESIRDAVSAQLSKVDYSSIQKSPPTNNLGNDEEITQIHESVLKSILLLDALASQITSDINNVINEARNSVSAKTWTEKLRRHEEQYAEAYNRIKNVRIPELSSQIESKKEILSKTNDELTLAQKQAKLKQELLKTRDETLQSINRELNVISTLRNKQAKQMSKALNNRVMISIQAGGNRQALLDWLNDKMKSRQIRESHLNTIFEGAITPHALADLIRSNDQDKIAKELGLSPTVAGSLIMTFSQDPSLLYELEEITFEDLPNIRMKRDDNVYRDLDQLSTGQKFTVIILLALTDDDKPIVYDQPEDALDTAMIYTDIAQILRNAKDKRQFIFATHNSNMSVSADLDLAIVLDASASSAQVAELGGLEREGVRKLLIKYLEGGTEAMQQRVRKYGNSFFK